MLPAGTDSVAPAWRGLVMSRGRLAMACCAYSGFAGALGGPQRRCQADHHEADQQRDGEKLTVETGYQQPCLIPEGQRAQGVQFVQPIDCEVMGERGLGLCSDAHSQGVVGVVRVWAA